MGVLSGPGLASDYERHTGLRCNVPELLALASTGDREAAGALDRYMSRAARGLAAIITVLDPHVIVVGGGLSNIDLLYERIPQLWGRWVFAAGRGEAVHTRLVRARYGDASGVRGAAWLWPDG